MMETPELSRHEFTICGIAMALTLLVLLFQLLGA